MHSLLSHPCTRKPVSLSLQVGQRRTAYRRSVGPGCSQAVPRAFETFLAHVLAQLPCKAVIPSPSAACQYLRRDWDAVPVVSEARLVVLAVAVSSASLSV